MSGKAHCLVGLLIKRHFLTFALPHTSAVSAVRTRRSRLHLDLLIHVQPEKQGKLDACCPALRNRACGSNACFCCSAAWDEHNARLRSPARPSYTLLRLQLHAVASFFRHFAWPKDGSKPQNSMQDSMRHLAMTGRSPP